MVHIPRVDPSTDLLDFVKCVPCAITSLALKKVTVYRNSAVVAASLLCPRICETGKPARSGEAGDPRKDAAQFITFRDHFLDKLFR